jgi:hypothetical protein
MEKLTKSHQRTNTLGKRMYLKGAKGKPEKNAQGFKYNYKKRAI